MKNLRKIIGFFLLIFILGIAITAISINKTLHKKNTHETVEYKKENLDSLETTNYLF